MSIDDKRKMLLNADLASAERARREREQAIPILERICAGIRKALADSEVGSRYFAVHIEDFGYPPSVQVKRKSGEDEVHIWGTIVDRVGPTTIDDFVRTKVADASAAIARDAHANKVQPAGCLSAVVIGICLSAAGGAIGLLY